MERGVTRPSIPSMLATLLLVAFFCELGLLHCFFRVEPWLSSSSNDSEDEGDMKIAEYV